MIRGLLYSFRKNAGIYKDSPFTVITNGNPIPEPELSSIKNQFLPVDLRVMPRLGGAPHTNKFNAFYAIDESTYDVLVLMDCDTVVLEPLDEIVKGIDIEKPSFKAIGIGKAGASTVIGYHHLVKHYANLSDNELKLLKSEEFRTEYPCFNSGVIVISRKAVLSIRNDAIQIAYELYDRQYPKSLKDEILFPYYALLTRGRFQTLPDWMKRAIRSLLPRGAIFCRTISQSEQYGLGLSLIKNKVEWKLLHYKYNLGRLMQDGSLPNILHYIHQKKEIQWDNLCKGNWIQKFTNSNCPLKRSLAEILISANSTS
jgi:hypothetical protein